MRRVLIIGSPGSGKSTLAKKLADRTGLPLVHLDKLYWRPNWIEPSKLVWQHQLTTVLAEPEWILDGSYGGTLPQRLAAADTAILLDLPTWLCIFRTLKRIAFGWGRNRPDMAIHCPERFDVSFLLYVWTFRRQKRSKLLEDLRSFSGQTLILRSPREVVHLLDSLQNNPTP